MGGQGGKAIQSLRQLQRSGEPSERVWVGALWLWCLSGSELKLGGSICSSVEQQMKRFSVNLARGLTAPTARLDLDLRR